MLRNAENAAPMGPAGDVVRLLRQRGRRAAFQTKVFLIALILIVLVALVFYLGLPQFKQYVDGRRLTLVDNREAAAAAAAELDTQRIDLKAELLRAIDGEPVGLQRDWSGSATLWQAVPAGDGAVLVFGDEGTVIRYDIAAGTAEAVQGDWSGRVTLWDAVPASDGAVLLIGDAGTVIRFSDHLAREITALELDTEQEFLDQIKRLPPALSSSPDVVQIRSRVVDIVGQRRVITEQLMQIEQDLENLPSGFLFLNERRQEFADFMKLCRGVSDGREPPKPTGATDADPDAVTLACTQAWQVEKQSELSSWWQTVAQQAPPAILLLFLLATFSGLYRYNMRLAGFHYARADALVLMADRGVPLADLNALADALAADKVEFGKGNTPSDQAVELFRSLAGRVKPGAG